MKKILLILFSLFAITAFAQFPSQQSQGSPSTQIYSKGAYGVDSGFVYRYSFADTTAANRGFIKNIPGIQIRTSNDLWLRNSTATAWIKFLNTVDGGGTGLSDGDKTDVEVSSFGSVFIVEGIQGESLPTLVSYGFIVRRDGAWVYDTIAVSDLPDTWFDENYFDGTGTFDNPITLINIYTKDQVDSAIAAGGGANNYLEQPTITYGALTTYLSFPRNGLSTLDLDLIAGQATTASNIPFHNGSNLAWNSGLAVRASNVITSGSDTLATKAYARSVGGGVGTVQLSKSWIIEAPADNETFNLHFFDDAVTITKVVAVVTGASSPDIDIDLRFKSDVTAGGTQIFASPQTVSSTTTGNSFTSFSDATVDADTWLALNLSGITGTVATITITIYFQ